MIEGTTALSLRFIRTDLASIQQVMADSLATDPSPSLPAICRVEHADRLVGRVLSELALIEAAANPIPLNPPHGAATSGT